MINDPTMAIDCDNCYTTIFYNMPFVYDDYTGDYGHYNSNDADIEDFVKEMGWIVTNDKQFCCKDCMRKFFDRN